MTQEQKDLLLKDLCARLPYFTKVQIKNEIVVLDSICDDDGYHFNFIGDDREGVNIENIKPYLFPLSSMTEEDNAIYFKIWEDTGKMAYLEGCHHLIINIKAYKAANDYLLSKHYDVNGLIPMGLANDATGKNIYQDKDWDIVSEWES